ncbi:MAG: hydroxyisourate hydrolase [Herbaspirillum sp.]
METKIGNAVGKLSTHVLDTTLGQPGAGVEIELYVVKNGQRSLLKRVVTNHDGRCDAPLLERDAMQVGQYELVFAAGDYFARQSIALPTPRFIDRVTLAFGIADTSQNYHVPLLVSPWAYSTYRGS